MKTTVKQVKQNMDVALLKPTATTAEIETLAKTLREEGFRYFCVNSIHTTTAARALEGSNVQVVTCVGFPHGTVKTSAKVFETEEAIAEGAGEIDMVLDLGALFAGNYKQAEADVRAVVQAAQGRPVKVIIETPFLNMRQKIDASRIVKAGGAAFGRLARTSSSAAVAAAPWTRPRPWRSRPRTRDRSWTTS